MHALWRESEPMSCQIEMVQFNKDLALAGAALGFFWVFSQAPALTLTGPLFLMRYGVNGNAGSS